MRRRAIATILIGPNGLLRDGLACILSAPKFRIIASAARWEDVNIAPVEQYETRLLVTESSESPAAAIESIKLFKQHSPNGRVAVLGNRLLPSDIILAFQAGANVYFEQVAASAEFVKALELVMLGQTILPLELLSWAPGGKPGEDCEAIAAPEAIRKKGLQLSTREKGILDCIARGASNKMIAREMDISEATVKVHVKTILRKIGVCNRTQAAIWAMSDNSAGPAYPSRVLPRAPALAPVWQNGASKLASPNGHDQMADGLSLSEGSLRKGNTAQGM